jgi:hypothetical protein
MVGVGRIESDDVAAGEVVVWFLGVLSKADLVLDAFVEGLEGLEMRGRGRVDGFFEGKDVKRWKRVIASRSKEGGGFGGSRDGVVVREFGERKEVAPVVLVVTAEDAKEGFDDGVRALVLADGLVMMGGGEVRGGAESDEEGFPEGGDKGAASIGWDVGLEAMGADDGVKVLGGQSGSVEAGVGIGDEVDHLGEVVWEDLDCVVASFRSGELGNTIDGDVSPGSRWDRQRFHETEGR